MPDPDSPPPSRTEERRRAYPTPPAAATPSLHADLVEKITRGGPLAFSDFMAAALYDPARGYYARTTRQVGRGGDFFTSVSVGPLFGELLARRFLREWAELGKPDRWRILECGAHDGTLARDVLGAIRRLDPVAFATVEYATAEPLPSLRGAQIRNLAEFSENFRGVPSAAALEPMPGVIFGNELLDALPFDVIVRRGGAWLECRVGLERGDFIWHEAEIRDPALAAAVAELPQMPDGSRAEVRTCFGGFLKPLLPCLTRGVLLWADYGFARPELYAPGRRDGTLRTFSKHRAGEDPLAAPGEVDITAHVDFTACAEAAVALGCVPVTFRNQGAWLTEAGRDWLLTQEGNPRPEMLRQFQTLTHPAHLGGSFHVLELAWGKSAATPEADWHRLALRACPVRRDP